MTVMPGTATLDAGVEQIRQTILRIRTGDPVETSESSF